MKDFIEYKDDEVEDEEILDPKEPPMYRVMIYNDDYTPYEFVEEVLILYFNKTAEEASMLTSTIHHTGIGIAGIYTRDVAETKMELSYQLCQTYECPLKLTIEADR